MQSGDKVGERPFKRGNQVLVAAIPKADPDNAYVIGAHALEEDEVLVFGHYYARLLGGLCRVLPNSIVVGPFQTNVVNMNCRDAPGSEPFSQRGRQLRINQQLHVAMTK